MILDYSVAVDVVGLAVLVAFGFYALKLVASFRTGMLARSWKQVTVGAIFLIAAQFPLLVASLGFPEGSLLLALGMVMRFGGVAFLTIGLRAQCKVWWIGSKIPSQRSGLMSN